jgi:two-component system sensor histidine kinase VicK
VEVQQDDSATAGVLRFIVRPVRQADSGIAMIIIEDVTQQRVAAESRSAFLGRATHELRTPLTNIRLYVETALVEGKDDPAVRAKCLNVINEESARLERIVSDILSVSEIEAGALEIKRDDVRLDVLFEQLKADYEPQARERQIKLTFDLPPKLPVFQGDCDKIALALHNLLGNALKYTPTGGQVTVYVNFDQNQIAIDVTDTGIGIGEGDIEKVFEKFYRAKDQRITDITGSGMGLAIAREVIRLHGGDITVQSELNKGSNFTLTLPVPNEAA